MSVQVGNWWGNLHSLAAEYVSYRLKSNLLCLLYLAERSSVLRARPGVCVSCIWVEVGWGAYVKQRLNSRGVLGGLFDALVS
jgi:hypothetical protein